MKKLFVLLAGILLWTASAVALTPQEIAGVWTMKVTSTNAEMGMNEVGNYTYTFNEDGTVSMKGDQAMTMNMNPVTVNMYIKVEAAGTFTVDADSIVITPNADSVVVKFTEDDIRITGLEDATKEEEACRQIYAQFSQAIPMMVEGMKETDTFTNVVVMDKKMMCMNNGQALTFKRKKK